MRKNSFFEKLNVTKLEREVELVYKKELNYYYPDIIISNPYGCDGLIEKGKLKLIMELKYNEDFADRSVQCKVIVQALYYIKKFQINDQKLPNIILIGDKDEVFLVTDNIINKYIDEEVDWSLVPSKASMKNIRLVLKMVKDDTIIPFVFHIDEKFSFQTIINQINEITNGLKTYVAITEKNISSVFDYFIINVIRNYRQYNTNDLVRIFITLMTNPNKTYLHTKKKNILILQDKSEIFINGDRFTSFFEYFKKDYTPKEKDKFTEIADRLLEDTSRRKNGEFYTPTSWVSEAHEMISRTLGDKWKDEYVVWDCAWGTGNLTRDYYFKNLYCSTLHKSDLEIGERYNKSAVKFQYDFLNDDINLLENNYLLTDHIKMPINLLESLHQNKPIVFFINPPYGAAGTMKTDGSSKKDICKTKTNRIMKNDKIGSCSQQLFAQFLYKILLFKAKYNLDNVVICLFSSPIFMTGSSFKKFREKFLTQFEYRSGMLFSADEFDDVSKGWGVSFNIWTSGKTSNKNIFIHELKQLSHDVSLGINKIINLGNKKVYNIDGSKSFSDWIKEDINYKTYDAPLLSSALVIKEHGYGKLVKEALGYYVNSGNSIYDNNGDVFIVSGCSSRGHGISILPNNFNRVMANFASRKCMTGEYSNWKNNKDEYYAPNTGDKRYKEWNSDAIIYSLFNTSSNQSSLRNIKYKENLWNIQNEFFFMSNDHMLDLANKYTNDELYIDAKSFRTDRYAYKIISEIKLSYEASIVLNKARYLVEKSFQFRDIMNEEHPEYFLNTWDAGWYQIKLILKKYLKEDLSDFNYLYKILEQKLRSQIYDLGILRR
ncbi:hypothetical protein [Clostridium tunisiense]|uniref:hypothetical protein n=1 Tax=Clostridium tunisiense TaxID=219748 RepID=UPI0002E08913|nr:hypothetical protein [Clostridium tunisiense]